jgi:type I restriction enzyme S subunit
MRGFKHIAVDELPAGWLPKYFSELTNFSMGKTPSRNHVEFWDKGVYPWVSIRDMEPFGTIVSTKEKVSEKAHEQVFRRTLVAPGSLLMSFKLTIGRVAKVGVPTYHNEAIISFWPDAKHVDSDFLFYYLAQINYRDYQDTAVKGQTLNKGKLKQLEIALPPIAEQRKIAAVLSVVQRAIEQLERLLQLTAELKKTLLHQLFTHGLRGEAQKETDIGLVPESWEVAKIGDVAKLQSGGTPARDVSDYWQGGTIHWVKTGEIDYCDIRATEERITPAGLANSSAKLFPEGTLLMAMYGQGITRGRVAILGIEAATNQACAAISPRDESRVSSRFLYYFFEYHYENLRKLGHGANQRNMNAALIRGFPVAYPTSIEQAEIVSALTALDAKAAIHQRKHAALTDLFRTLLHQLMTAQIRVHDLDLPELD